MDSYGLKLLIDAGRLGGRWLLFIILALAVAKTPLAYSCVPLQDNNSQPVSQLTNAGVPCHTSGSHTAFPQSEEECCLINIDSGLRGAEAGFILSPLQSQQSADLPALPPDLDAWLWPEQPIAQHPPARADTALLSVTPPPYLLTQRLRI